jgi:hypothetical protein
MNAETRTALIPGQSLKAENFESLNVLGGGIAEIQSVVPDPSARVGPYRNPAPR